MATQHQVSVGRAIGVEGPCVACGLAVHTHFDARGRWVGCRRDRLAAQIDPQTPFLLIPERRGAEDRRMGDRRETGSGTTAATVPVREPAQPAPSVVWGQAAKRRRRRAPRVAYVAKFPVSHPRIVKLPERDQLVYRTILKARAEGTTARAVASALGVKTRGVIESAIQRLQGRHKVISRYRLERAQ